MVWLASVAVAADPQEEAVAEVVVVTAGRTPHAAGTHPVAIEVVGRAEIEASGAETLADILQEQPGVAIDRTPTGSAIRLQGMEPEHTLILIDGRRVLGRKDGVIDLSRLDLSNVESIEIAKGTGSALYGSDAMGGVIHILTRRPSSSEVGGRLRFGSRHQVDAMADVSVDLGASRHRIGGAYHASDAWDQHPENPATDASAIEQGDVDYSGSFDASERTTVRLDVEYMRRHLTAVDGSVTGAVLDRLQTLEDVRTGLNLRSEPSEAVSVVADVALSLYRDQFVLDQRGGKGLDLASDNRERMVEASTQVTFERGVHHLTVGMDGLQQHLTTERLETGQATRTRVGAFASDLLATDLGGATLNVNPSVRADVDSQFGSAFTPRLAASLVVGETVNRLSVGTGFRAPDFRELYLLFENPGVGYVVAGNPGLRPERSANVSVASEWARDTLSLSGSLFYNRVQDLIAIDDVDLEPGALQRFGYDNIARARILGGELSGRMKLGGGVALELGYAGTDARDLDADRLLPGRVPHRVTGSADLRVAKGLHVRAQGGWNSSRFIYLAAGDQEEVEVVPSLLTVDVRGRARIDDLEAFIGVDNLLGAKGTSWSPQPPRLIYGGLTFRGGLQ